MRVLPTALTACAVWGFSPVHAEPRTADVDGAKIHYERYEPNTTNAEPALVFIHGWTCDLTFWRGQAPVYQRHRSLLIDLPGHGLSDKPHRPYPMEYFARSVEAVMKDAGVEQAILIGHSLGGPISYAFLRLFPEQVKALVLVDADVRPGSAGPIHPDQQRAIMAKRARAMQTAAGDRAFARNVESMFSQKTPEPLREEIRGKMLATPKHVRIGAVTSPSSLPPPRKDEFFDIPAIAIQAVAPGTETRFSIMRGLFPSLRLETWVGNGHFLMMEEPERFNRSLEAFLSGLASY
jgi:pimeloyl-ACP methyl ester carboxylesterase